MSDQDLEARLADWFAIASDAVAPQPLREAVLGLPDLADGSGAVPRPGSRSWRSRARLANLELALAIAAAVVAVMVGIDLVPVSDGVGGPLASASASASASVAPSVATVAPEPARIIGLPPEGTTPSSAEPGELVLSFAGTRSGLDLWVYADGRLISTRFHHVRADATEAFIGFSEQRLTPSGVEFLRSAVIGTGLFDSDLVLAREGNAPFLGIQVRNLDRLVNLTWAWRGIAGDAPPASPDQESALTALDQLLTDPASWPESAWADATMKEFVPSEYLLCFEVANGRDPAVGAWKGPMEPGGIWPLLPGPAQDLLHIDARTQQHSMHNELGCARMTTDDARTLARVFDAAGMRRYQPEWGSFWLKYTFTDPDVPGNEVWIPFAPVLPHGEAVYLGPG